MTKRGTTVRQINNLKINRNIGDLYLVYAPNGVCLEQFVTLACAVAWCKKTKDFVRRKK